MSYWRGDFGGRCFAIILVNQSVCIGCRLCELACSFTLFKEFNPSKSAIRVHRDEISGTYFPVISPFGGILTDPDGNVISCKECSKPPCIEWCPTNALVKGD
ncbi:MAG: 4Fe-4S dicluster domain-containing protein [Candidatus Korarchaeota archaeon]|nr:4Fe-4S dicluster domain-containing protein [Candidatus Korarchaeota archaeon]